MKTKTSSHGRCGFLTEDGNCLIIHRPVTPYPWVNILSTGTYGSVLRQDGAGYSWLASQPSCRLTPPDPKDPAAGQGRCLYLRDDATGRFWSAAHLPVESSYDHYECIHGLGYTHFITQAQAIQSQWMVFVPHGLPMEIWRLRVKNLSGRKRSISAWSHLRWDWGADKAPARAAFEDNGKIVVAQGTPRQGVRWHGVSRPVRSSASSVQAFVGARGTLASPAALRRGRYVLGGSSADAAGTCVTLALKPNEEKSFLYTLGAAKNKALALELARRYQDFSEVDWAWHQTEVFWDKYLSTPDSPTKDPSFRLLTNPWQKYQALSTYFWMKSNNGSPRP